MKFLGNKAVLFYIIALTAIVLVSYAPIFKGFFQQDEWFAFGYYFKLQQEGIKRVLLEFFSPNIGHYVPFHQLISYALVMLGKTDYQLYAMISILLHLFVVGFVFFIALFIFKRPLVAFLTALFFGLNGSIHQATSWVLVDVSTHGASLFGALSLLWFFLFIKRQRRIFFYLSIGSLVISLLFKEIAFGLFALLPIAIYLFDSKRIVKMRSDIIVIIMLALLYISLRILFIFLPSPALQAPLVTESQSKQTLLYNTITFPAKSLTQTLVPQGALMIVLKTIAYRLPDDLTGKKEIILFGQFVEQRLLEPVSLLIFIVFGVIVAIVWLRNKSDTVSITAFFGFLFVVLNSWIFAFSPERSGGIVIIDSRNLYFVSIGTAFLVAALLQKFFSKNNAKVLTIFVFLIGIHSFWLTQEMGILSNVGRTRSAILDTIHARHTDLPSRVIFYTESDKSYYGLPENERILPFQSGVGQMLLVSYHQTEQFPKEFFEERFLWDIKSQGYKQINNRGFGYFRVFEELAKTVKNNKLDPSSVIAFQFDSEKQIIEDITEEVRGRLEGYLAEKREVSQQIMILASTQNPKDLQNAKDGNRNTVWDSKLAYENPQSIIIEFPTYLVIAQIQIDSYNNKDQNEIGYKILISQDGEHWNEVFYAKRYVPDNEGIVNLYIKPQQAKFVKIEQIGYHQFASWVVHEIKLYEKLK